MGVGRVEDLAVAAKQESLMWSAAWEKPPSSRTVVDVRQNGESRRDKVERSELCLHEVSDEYESFTTCGDRAHKSI